MPQENTRVDPVRIPLVGSYNTRLFGLSDLGPTSGIVGVGVVGQMIVGNLATFSIKDQRFVNAIPDALKTPLTDAVKWYCYKRPGFAGLLQPADGEVGTAVRIWTGENNEVISAFGDVDSEIFSGVASLGTVTGVAYDIVEADVAGVPTLLIPTDDNKLYWYQASGAITEVTDGDFPSNNSMTITGSPVNMNGYTFIMTTNGRIYNSDLNSITNWSATSFLSTNAYPDKGVGLARYKDMILAFGQETVEFFRNVENESGSPLQRVKEATIRLGCIGPSSIVQFEDNLAWVAGSDIGTLSVYMLDGYRPVRVSDNVVDAFLGTKGGQTVYMTAAKMRGKTFIFLVFGSTTWVYCVEDKTWHEWLPGSTVLWHKFATSSAASEAIFSVSRTSTTGKVFIVNPVTPVYTDDGEPYQFMVQTSKIDFNNTSRKRLHKLSLVADNTLEQTPMEVSWTDDDYESFGITREMDLSRTDKYLMNLGQFRRRAFKFENLSDQALRLEALDLYYSQGLK